MSDRQATVVDVGPDRIRSRVEFLRILAASQGADRRELAKSLRLTAEILEALAADRDRLARSAGEV